MSVPGSCFWASLILPLHLFPLSAVFLSCALTFCSAVFIQFLLSQSPASPLFPDPLPLSLAPGAEVGSRGPGWHQGPLSGLTPGPCLQRSQISYKCHLVLCPIPELLRAPPERVWVAVPRRPPPSGGLSSSSDSEEEELEELPSVPRPLQPEFSGSRVSLTDIPTEDEALGTPEAGATTPMDWQEQGRAPSQDQEAPSPEALPSPGQEPQAGSSPQRRELRRGSSAESALPRAGPREPGRGLHKAASVELPQRRSPSPGATRLTRGGLGEGEYAQRLQALRQRLLRGGPEDGKVSGLRGPLLESLGGRTRDPRLARAASSEAAPRHQPPPETWGLQKSSSFSQGEAEPRGRHRRAGAPLEIPVARLGARRLQESPSLSALSEAQPPSPARPSASKSSAPKSSVPKSLKPPATTPSDAPQPLVPQPAQEKSPKPKLEPVPAPKRTQPPVAPQSPVPPLTPYAQIMQSLQLSGHTQGSLQDPGAPPSEPRPHPAVFARVASPAPGASEKPVPTAGAHPVLVEKARVPTVPRRPGSSLSSSIENLESEAVFEAKFKRSRESPLSRGLRLLSRSRSEERGPFRGAREEDGMYRPSPAGTPLELVRRPERSHSVQDLRAVGEPGLVRRLSLSLSHRLRRTPPAQRHPAWEARGGDGESSEGGSSARGSPVLAVRRRLSSTLERLSSRLQRSGSSEDSGGASGRSTPLFGRLRRATSEGESLRRLGVPHNQLAAQAGASTPSAESLGSEASGTSGSSGEGAGPRGVVGDRDTRVARPSVWSGDAGAECRGALSAGAVLWEKELDALRMDLAWRRWAGRGVWCVSLQVRGFPGPRAAGRRELSGTGWASASGSGSSQVLGKAEAGGAGASPGYERKRAIHSQTSLPVLRKIWVTSMCAVSQVRGLLGE